MLFVLLLTVGLVGGAAYGAKRVLSAFGPPPDYPGPGAGEAVVQVTPGQTAGDVATILQQTDVVASRQAFLDAANADPRSRSVQPGFYRLLRQLPAKSALDLLLDPTSRVVGRVTVPEGMTVKEIVQTVAKGTSLSVADLEAAAANPAALGLPAYAAGRLEGFLFPATYDIQPGTSAVEVLKMMVARFDQAAQSTGLVAGSAALGMTPYQLVTVASLVERESRVVEELPKVSRVIYNRLARQMPLGVDAAVLYGLGRSSGPLSKADLDKDTPYNNRLRAGLPPTPIAAPGEAALKAALAPSPGDWLYYVLADASGRHLFTASVEEFDRQVAKSQREGLF